MNLVKLLTASYLLLTFLNVYPQHSTTIPLKLQTAVEIALKNNPQIKNAELQVKKSELSRIAAWEIQPTEFTYTYGQINSPLNDRYLDVHQHFGSLLTPIQKSIMAKKQVSLNLADMEIQKRSLTAQVKSAYYFWWFQNEKLNLAKEEAGYLSDIQRIAELRYSLGETGELEKLNATAKAAEILNQINIFSDELLIAENKLKLLMVSDINFIPPPEPLSMYKIDKQSDTSFYSPSIITDYYKKYHEVCKAAIKTERSQLFPGFFIGYFYQDIYPEKGLSGWQAGISIPLLAFDQSAKIRQAKLDAEMALNQLEYMEFSTNKTIENLIIELTKYFRQIEYYNQFGLQQADEILRNAELHFKKENIEYFEYIQHIASAFEIKQKYLETINNYNQTAIQLELYAY
jgi:cobalt-zinc-cadmium resistance protein CzcA